MPLMTKIRENMTKAFAVFAGVFVVYIVLDWGMDLTGRASRNQATQSQIVGVVDDHEIPYQTFADMLKQAAENQKMQTGKEPDETQLRTLRDQVWNQLVDDYLYEQEIDRLGITVPDQEIIDWVRGPNPPEVLKNQFTDSTGTFHRADYETAIQNPKNRDLLVKVEEFLRKQRAREKLQSILLAGIRVSEGDVLQRYMEQNIRYEGEYAFFDPNQMVADNEISVSDDDLRKYYNEHSEQYKSEPTRKLKYVVFNEAASKGDTDAVLNDLKDILNRANAGADFAGLAETYSDVPPTNAMFKHGEISAEKENAVFNAAAGQIVGPVQEPDGFHLIRVNEFKTGTEDYIRASHILIRIEGNDSATALKTANEAAARVRKGEDFAQVAREKSADGSAQKGGDIGWFGKGRMVKPFEDAAFKAKVGQIVGPVKTQFGYHVIKVTGRDNREVSLTDLRMAVKPGMATRENIAQMAEDFAHIAKENDFLKEAQGQGFNVLETPAFQKGAFISGIGTNLTLNKFAFNNKVGAVSNAVYTQNAYVVAMVSGVNDAGMKPFDEVKPQIEAAVKLQKKMEKLAPVIAQVKSGLGQNDSLKKISSLQPKAVVARLMNFTLNGFLPGIGRDAGFAGAIANLPANEISQPIKGERGYYLAKVESKTPFDSTTYDGLKESLRTQILNERKNRFLASWSEDLKKRADIVDNRDLFFR